ncbi:MAG: bacillithiol biosynthesis BshC [Candidatus Eisenbacteria bacterium]
MAAEAAPLRRRPFPAAAGDHLRDYWAGAERLRELYPHFPLARPVRTGEATSAGPVDGETARRIAGLNEAAGGPPARGLGHLGGAPTRFVLAGQQPGLLLGPPLAAYKMMSAAALARSLDGEDAPVVPLFWIASHDSDLPEVDGVVVPGPEGDPRTIRYPFRGGHLRRRVGTLTVAPEEWRSFLAGLRDALPPTGFRDECIALAESLTGGEETTLTLLFARLARRFFPKTDLLFFDGGDAEIDPRGRAVLAAAARRPGAASEALRAGAARLRERGIEPPLPAEPGRALFFLLEGETRVPVLFDEDGIGPESGERMSPGELAGRIEEGTVRATPNAALRPVVQDAVFPNAATVVGLSELVYHGELGPLYDLMGVRRPLLVPRAGYAVVPARTEEKLRDLGLEWEDLFAGEEPSGRGGAAGTGEGRFLTGAKEILAAYLEETERRSSGAVPPDDPARSRFLKEAERTVRRVRKLADRAGENRRNRIHRARQEILPGGKPQEAAISFFSLAARFGLRIAEDLARMTGPEEPVPHLVTVGGRKDP